MADTLTLAEAARTLTQQAYRGMLSTISDHNGAPYGSLVDICPVESGNLITLMSQLAEHQHFVSADPRASILIAPDMYAGNALARPRLSLIGTVTRCDVDEATREHYISRHPDAAMYLQLGDFHFYQLSVERVRYIAGFGRMGWLTADDYQSAEPDPLWEIAPGAVEHMNDDHADSLVSYTNVLGDADWATAAELLAVDRLGMDIIAINESRRETIRVPFEPPLASADELRPRLVRMAQQIRSQKTP